MSTAAGNIHDPGPAPSGTAENSQSRVKSSVLFTFGTTGAGRGANAGTQNGVFLWMKQRALESGDELRVGRQRLRIEWIPDEPEDTSEQQLFGSPNPGYAARAVQLLEGGGDGDIYPLKAGDNLIGRGTGDVSFPSDGYVSSRHAMITVNDGALSVKDLGSANGTFVRISGSAPVSSGDLLLVGEQILRIDPA